MNANPPVNRHLEDEAIDHIDHALGRPLFPLRESYRNYFATSPRGDLAATFERSPYWERTATVGDMAYFGVTDAGRQVLAAHLASIPRKWRAFEVSFAGFSEIVPAATAGKARYSRYLAITDVLPDLSFAEFARKSSVREAA